MRAKRVSRLFIHQKNQTERQAEKTGRWTSHTTGACGGRGARGGGAWRPWVGPGSLGPGWGRLVREGPTEGP